MEKGTKSNFTAFVVILSLTLLLSFPYLNVGLDRDEGAYLLIASKILRGGVPYRDVMESKPVAFYFFLTIPAYIFGNWINGLRIFGFIIIALTAFMIFLIGKNIRDTGLGFISAFIFVFLQLFIPGMFGFLLLSETVSNLFVVLAIYLLFHKKLDSKIAFIIGSVSSLAFLIRQTSLFLVAIVLPYIYYNKSIKKKSNHLYYFLLGVFSIISIFIIYLILNSAIGDAIYHTFLSMLDPYGPYATGGDASLNIFKIFFLMYFFYNNLAITLLAIIGIMTLQGIKEKIVILWFILSLASSQISPSVFFHYYIIVLPAFSLLAGIGCKNVLGAGKIFYKNKIVYYSLSILSIVILAILLIAQFSNFVFYPIFSMASGKAYIDTLSYNDEIFIMDMLKNTTKGEHIFVFPSEPQIYYLTGKDPISKKIHFNAVWFTNANYSQMEEYIFQPISEKMPKYIIIANNTHFESINKTDGGRIFMQYIYRHYHLSKETGIAQIYEIN